MTLLGCIKAMKWILVLFNILVLCAGAIAIGLGAWGLGSEYGAEKLRDLTGSELYRGGAIAIIVGGCIIVVISFLGAAGAILENRIMLGIYFVITLLLLILFVVAASVGYAYRDILEEKIVTQMDNTMLTKYGVDEDVTSVWDDMQRDLDCCGVKGRTPSSANSWFRWQSSTWFRSSQNMPLKYVPESCCSSDIANTSLCVNMNPDTTKPVQNTTAGVTHYSEYVHEKGCYDALVDKVMEHIVAIAGIAIAIIVVLFLCLLFSICVCTHVGKQSLVI